MYMHIEYRFYAYDALSLSFSLSLYLLYAFLEKVLLNLHFCVRGANYKEFYAAIFIQILAGIYIAILYTCVYCIYNIYARYLHKANC